MKPRRGPEDACVVGGVRRTVTSQPGASSAMGLVLRREPEGWRGWGGRVEDADGGVSERGEGQAFHQQRAGILSGVSELAQALPAAGPNADT